LLGVYNSFDEIDFNDLPDKFVLKATHGSGYNVIVLSKADMNIKAIRKKFNKWMNMNYYNTGREKNYLKIRPRIICDSYLEVPDGMDLPEAKVYCFNGKARFIAYNLIGGKTSYSNQYDCNWNPMDVKFGFPQKEGVEIPHNKDEIIELAERLAKPFNFVRVDLYVVGNRIIFSEMTFYPGGGMVPLSPPSSEIELGNYFECCNE
jgi:hypothetical protein